MKDEIVELPKVDLSKLDREALWKENVLLRARNDTLCRMLKQAEDRLREKEKKELT